MLNGWIPFSLRDLQRLSIRATVFLGFGVIVGLWLVLALDSAWRISEAEDRMAEANWRFNTNEQALFTVRSLVPMAEIVLYAYLDSSGPASADYRRRLAATRDQIEIAMARYSPLLEAEPQRETWQKLREQIDAYWAAIQPVMGWDRDQKVFLSKRHVRRSLMERRELILNIFARMQSLNRFALEKRREELAGIHEGMRQRLWWTLGVSALLAGLVVVVIVWHAGSLEQQILRQNAQEEQNKNELRRLSTRLVNAQEQERGSIARELHDEVGQALTALKMELALAERELAESAAARVPLREARAISDRTMQAVRDLSHLLHPAMLDHLGLSHTVEWNLRGFANRTGIRANMVCEDADCRFPAEVEIAAYRIIQEALNNVARHSKASRCVVRLERGAGKLVVSIEDDGGGFQLRKKKAAPVARGLGLVGMQERAMALGGRFEVISRPGEGTRVIAELPFEVAGEQPPPREVGKATAATGAA